jgi:hypothetical protein
MAFVIKKASRTVSKMRIGLFGVSGSGKTYGALLLAKGLVGEWGKIVVIDTENGSADLYSHLGDYSSLILKAPFTPERYIEAIKFCERSPEKFECIIIDSISHEWMGEGGCLEMQDKIANMPKMNSYTAWAKISPSHNRFLQTIIQSDLHIISCGRTKIDYNFEAKTLGGKGRVEKIGMKKETREGFDYEMTVAFQISQEHMATVDKVRTDLFNTDVPFMLTEEVGLSIKKWNDSGVEQKKPEMVDNLSQKIFGYISKLTNKYEDKEKLNLLLQEMAITKGAEITGLAEEVKLEIIAMLEQKISERSGE